jgi:integrating conjugative element protein (TIGR03759 family)
MPKHRIIQTLSVLATVLLTSASAGEVNHSQDLTSQTQALQMNRNHQRRLQWQLSKPQWQRYTYLMEGMRGSISPATISPLEVLGTHARNDQERRKYARLWATMMHDDVERILKFQNAYNVAWDSLYGNQPMVDLNQLNLKSRQPDSWQSGDHILLFVKINDCQRCQIAVHTAAKRALAVGAILDVYFVATKAGADDGLIRRWAQAASINPVDVKAKRITLNHESGELMELTGKVVTTFPVAYQLNGRTLRPIQIDRFK